MLKARADGAGGSRSPQHFGAELFGHAGFESDVEIIRLFDVYSAFDDPRAAVVLLLYIVRRRGGELECGDDASDARYFDLNGLPESIAFRAHRSALAEIKKQHAAGML